MPEPEDIIKREEKPVEANVSVETPQLVGDEPPLLLGLGTFSSPTEKLYGAFYFEQMSNDDGFRALNLSLFDTAEKLQSFDMQDQPLLFQQTFERVAAVAGEVTQADHKQARESVKKFLNEAEKRSQLWHFVENFDEENVQDWFYQLISSIIPKGKLNYNARTQLITRKALSRSMKGALTEKHRRSEDGDEDEKDEKLESEHLVSIITIPFKGVAPKSLQNDDEIYVRALGGISAELPDELQSEKYDFASKPLEATVLGVGVADKLPPTYEGNPEDYYEIKARFWDGEIGSGYVFKDERVKMVNMPEEDNDSGIDLTLVPYFIGIGIILVTIALAAFMIFG